MRSVLEIKVTVEAAEQNLDNMWSLVEAFEE